MTRMNRREVLAGVGLGAATLAGARVWGAARPQQRPRVTPPPEELVEKLKLDAFYKKHVSVGGLPIISSEKVNDFALLEAAYLVGQMLDGRDDLLQAIVRNKVRVVVMACDEFTCDVPEHSDLKPRAYWDRRSRGLGATPQRPATSCGEENLLRYPGDPYAAENILVHEFAHVVHHMGLNTIDKTFDKKLQQAYKAAMDKGLWKSKYAGSNRAEYWAEAVQSWFDTNRPPDHDHNHVDTREELKAYDPGIAKLVEEVFGDKPWRYRRPKDRKEAGHLTGYNRSKAPRFVWPERVLNAFKEHEATKQKNKRKAKA
jgi:hypothetical protein